MEIALESGDPVLVEVRLAGMGAFQEWEALIPGGIV